MDEVHSAARRIGPSCQIGNRVRELNDLDGIVRLGMFPRRTLVSPLGALGHLESDVALSLGLETRQSAALYRPKLTAVASVD